MRDGSGTQQPGAAAGGGGLRRGGGGGRRTGCGLGVSAAFLVALVGPAFEPDDRRLAHLLEVYGPPGALTASVGWYRAGSGTVAMSVAEQAPALRERIAVPTTVLWPEHDPLFPRAWSDRLEAFFSAAELEFLDGVGHFTPVEAPQAFAAAIQRRLAPSR